MSNINPPDVILLWCPIGNAVNAAYPPGLVDQSTGYPILEPYSYNGTHYTNETGVVIQLNTGVDLTSASSTLINVIQPNGSTTAWVGVVVMLNGVNSGIQYTTQTNDLYYPGTYQLQPAVVFSNWSGFGEIATFTISENIV